MQFTTFTLIFLFFGIVLAAPIDLARLYDSGIMKRSSHDGQSTDTSLVEGYSAGDSGISLSKSPARVTQVIPKRNDPREAFVEALEVMTPDPVRTERSGLVYNLHRPFNYKVAAVKIIYLGTGNKKEKNKKVKSEAKRLYGVQQLWGWGHTEDGEYHYFIMPYLGVAWDRVIPNHAARKLTKEMSLDLMLQAELRYQDQYSVIYQGKSLNQFVFMAEGNKWVANPVDWSQGTSRAEPGHGKDEKTLAEPFIIYPQDKVYRPPPETFVHCQL